MLGGKGLILMILAFVCALGFMKAVSVGNMNVGILLLFVFLICLVFGYLFIRVSFSIGHKKKI